MPAQNQRMLKPRMRLLVSVLLAVVIVALGQFALRAYYDPARGNPPDGVIILTTSWCPYCQALRKTLQAWQVPYTEYDVEDGWAGFWRHRASGAQGVPVTFVGEKQIYGLDLPAIRDRLSHAGYSAGQGSDPAK